KIATLRPSVREKVFSYTRQLPLSSSKAKMLAEAATSGLLTDDAGLVEMSNHLVETLVLTRHRIDAHLRTVWEQCDPETYFGLYGRLWLQSKYASSADLLDTIERSQRLWVPHERLGRVVGSFTPLFAGT